MDDSVLRNPNSKENLSLALNIVSAEWDLRPFYKDEDTTAELEAVQAKIAAAERKRKHIEDDDGDHPLVQRLREAQDLLEIVRTHKRLEKAEQQVFELEAELFTVSGKFSDI
jgi:hypothetical protein